MMLGLQWLQNWPRNSAHKVRQWLTNALGGCGQLTKQLKAGVFLKSGVFTGFEIVTLLPLSLEMISHMANTTLTTINS